MQIRIEICKARRREVGKLSQPMWYSQVFTDYYIDGDADEIEVGLAEYWDKTWQESISKASRRIEKAKWHWHNDRLSELIREGE